MQSHRKVFQNFYAEIIAGFIFLAAVAFVRLPFIVGSLASFSLLKASAPLLGLFGAPVTVFFFLARTGFRVFVHGVSFYNLFQYLPSCAGALYWATQSAWIRVGIPLVCIILFIAHPVGFTAAPYALYWLLPIFLYFFAPTSPFFQALASTFIMHGVGSFIWLYAGLLSSEQWLALIPVVALERLLFACAMTVAYYMIQASKKYFRCHYAVQQGMV